MRIALQAPSSFSTKPGQLPSLRLSISPFRLVNAEDAPIIGWNRPSSPAWSCHSRTATSLSSPVTAAKTIRCIFKYRFAGRLAHGIPCQIGLHASSHAHHHHRLSDKRTRLSLDNWASISSTFDPAFLPCQLTGAAAMSHGRTPPTGTGPRIAAPQFPPVFRVAADPGAGSHLMMMGPLIHGEAVHLVVNYFSSSNGVCLFPSSRFRIAIAWSKTCWHICRHLADREPAP